MFFLLKKILKGFECYCIFLINISHAKQADFNRAHSSVQNIAFGKQTAVSRVCVSLQIGVGIAIPNCFVTAERQTKYKMHTRDWWMLLGHQCQRTFVQFVPIYLRKFVNLFRF